MSDHGLTVAREVAEELLTQSRAELPNEACGLISGSLAERRGTRYHPARNADASPLRYTVDAADLVRITFAIEDAGEDLVAIYHSHTHSPAVPSATDRRAAMYPDQFYVLATLADPAAPVERILRAWRIHGGRSFEVPMRVEEPPIG